MVPKEASGAIDVPVFSDAVTVSVNPLTDMMAFDEMLPVAVMLLANRVPVSVSILNDVLPLTGHWPTTVGRTARKKVPEVAWDTLTVLAESAFVAVAARRLAT